VHGDPTKIPVLPVVKLTVPDGVFVLPLVVSVMVAVQVTCTFKVSVVGQATVVVVVILFTTVMLVVPKLPAWPVSPG
jgi:hypothetical protein